ncbi:hypothetical protein [Thalassobellus citreus]|uniref:hypothetical protein n=1 Tax=Thalassobellus citreus TaxID=3367752 RepID=UPI003799D209
MKLNHKLLPILILTLLYNSFAFSQIQILSNNIGDIINAGQGDLYLTTDTNQLYIGLSDGTISLIGNESYNGYSWDRTGNSNASNLNFLGTSNDIKFEIRSNNLPMLQIGRRQTLGLTQNFTDYNDNNQPLVNLNGDGTTSALQFTASGADFYKPMFFTTTEGNFRLKGSAAGTDYFEIGSAGTNNNGLFEIIIGDDGDEPITFKKYNYTTQTQIEMMRLQGTGLNDNVRVGIKTNGIMANSTLQVQGSLATTIFTTTTNLNLTENHHTVILGGNHNIILPNASTCTGRNYIIKNPTTNSNVITSYITLQGNTSTNITSESILWLQSDGVNWQQINSESSSSTSSGWSITGNSIATTNFIGTTNYQPLKFKVNSSDFGLFHPLGGINIGLESNANNNQGLAIGEKSNAGQQCSAYGYNADASGFQSNAFGYGAVASSNQSTAIGYNSIANGENATSLGHGATTNQDNAIVIGNTNDDTQYDGTKVGLGTSTPTRRLHVAGGFRLVDGTEGEGKTLISDANGNASWKDDSPIIAEIYNTIVTGIDSNTTWVTVGLNAMSIVSGNIQKSGNGIQVLEEGLYRITYRVSIQTETTANRRAGGMFRLLIDGSEANGSRSFAYARNTNNRPIFSTGSATKIMSLTGSELITIQAVRSSTNPNEDFDTVANGCNLIIEKL